ncbi:hypothetical protein ABIE89_004755 [Bradyrhizobium niftali]|uniref:hypothetical protein n=1 Tax=Bradyrhizobium niftali TaxID=2560055 RepID=UPI0038390AAF
MLDSFGADAGRIDLEPCLNELWLARRLLGGIVAQWQAAGSTEFADPLSRLFPLHNAGKLQAHR